MKKSYIKSNKKIALRYRPWNNEEDHVIKYLEPNEKIYILDNTAYDRIGEKKYFKIRLYSGLEGYVLEEAIKEVE